MSKEFRAGWKAFQESGSALGGALSSRDYVDRVEQEITNLQNNIDAFNGYNTPKEQLKGDIGEIWHNGTFNINAALNNSKFRTIVERENGFASVDISSNWGDAFGLKYYGNAAKTAKAQSIDYWEYFHKYGYNKTMDFETFLNTHGITPEEGLKNISIYFGQKRVVPSDQYEEILALLKRWQQDNANNLDNPERAALASKFEETLRNCVTKIVAPDGTTSYELSKDKAEEIAQLAKEGKFDVRANGFSTEDLITFEYVMKEAGREGLNAAMISLVISIAPEIFKCIAQLVKEGKIDKDQLLATRDSALNGAANGFLTGFTSAAIMTACKSGMLGATLKNVQPGIVSTLAVILCGTIKNGALVCMGKMESSEMANELIRTLFVSGCSIGFGMLLQLTGIPFAYLAGSFVGSMVGSFIYGKLDDFAMSLSINNGFTFFGLVEQNYELPKSVLKEIGIDVFEYDKFNVTKFEPDTFKPIEFKVDRFEYNKCWMSVIRRGVIGVHKVGFIID